MRPPRCEQRRSWPSHRTWAGRPLWTYRDIARMIDRCDEYEGAVDPKSPFLAFSQYDTTCSADLAYDTEYAMSLDEDALTPSSATEHLSDHVLNDRERHSRCPARDRTTPAGPSNNLLASLNGGREHPSLSPRGRSATLDVSIDIVEIERPIPPPQHHAERRLLHHFVTSTADIIVPVHGQYNPYKSMYPLFASQSTSATGGNAFYYALLAMSAFHLANLLGGDAGASEIVQASRHYGRALRKLRNDLMAPQSYNCILAALRTIALIEHAIRGNTSAWTSHFDAATAFVCRHASSRPWKKSVGAWTVSQSFALEYLVSQTNKNCDSGSQRIPDFMHEFIRQLINEPGFGYTYGGTAHIHKILYHIRCFEEELCDSYPGGFAGSMNTALQMKLRSIMNQLEMPIEDQVEIYIKHQETCGTKVSPQMRRSIHVHLKMFNVAVQIYLLSSVLRCPPCAVQEQVGEVLAATIEYIDLQKRGTFSIWPVFIATMQAYTPEAQALASRCWESAEAAGAVNRKEVHRLVRHVWDERRRLADTVVREPGGIYIDWREVMKALGVDVLLL